MKPILPSPPKPRRKRKPPLDTSTFLDKYAGADAALKDLKKVTT